MNIKNIWNKENLHPDYQIFILIVSLYSLIELAAEIMFSPDIKTLRILDITDYFVCAIFFIDFLIILFKSKNKVKYLLTWGWLDLLSSVPIFDSFRLLRIARIIRIIRFLRIMRSARIISKTVFSRKIQSVFLSIIVIVFTLVVTSSILVLNFESATNGPIKKPMDAIWWSISTLTTVGYGDVYPVSLEGRIVAIVLMIAGVGIFGTFSGFIASWIIGPSQKRDELDVAKLQSEIVEMKDMIKQLNETLSSKNKNNS